jgi:acyl-[acyl-carrier-protein]-phospholipid O-acyltransferase/long-chain-fatty-acid--[acyl-carrier-protein] ligase
MQFFSSRRFFPLFTTQFLGALNDNLLKNSLVMLITYQLAEKQGENAQLLVTLAAGLFILPFFLFSATAGQVSDKIDRAKITRVIKLAEIFIMLAAAFGFYLGSIWFLLTVLFLMGVHSTFFGPVKYALLPQHLHGDELLSGNAYIEAGTFLAILLGTILGGVLILHEQGVAVVSGALLAIALLGYFSSRFIPAASAPDPSLAVSLNIGRETWHIIGFARENKRVFLSIIGISWFWLVGATYLSQFPTYAKDVLNAQPEVVTLFLTVFSVGIGIGSFLCNKLLGGAIKSTYVFPAMLGMTLFGIDLFFASNSRGISAGGALIILEEFILSLTGLRILFDLLLISICAGLYIVPLYAIMQHDSSVKHRARIIAANNVMNAVFMVFAALATLAMLSAHFSIPQVFLIMAVANGVVAVYIGKLLPRIRVKPEV